MGNERLSPDESILRETSVGADTLSVWVSSTFGGAVYFRLYPPGVPKGEVICDTETTSIYNN